VSYITIIDGIAVISTNKVKSIETKLKDEPTNKEIIVTNSGIWFRDINKQNTYIINAKLFHENAKKLSNVRFFEFDKDNNFASSIYSKSASITGGFWILNNAKVVLTDGLEKIIKVLKIPTKLSFQNIDRITTNAKSIFFWTMSKYMSILEKAGLSSLKYKVHYFFRLSSIIQMIALTLLASAFCINHNFKNPKKYGIKIAILLSLAFPIHFANNIMTALGENGNIPVWIVAFTMPILTTAICYLIIRKK
jgi:lipopolysaccharide export system permease protein